MLRYKNNNNKNRLISVIENARFCYMKMLCDVSTDS